MSKTNKKAAEEAENQRRIKALTLESNLKETFPEYRRAIRTNDDDSVELIFEGASEYELRAILWALRLAEVRPGIDSQKRTNERLGYLKWLWVESKGT